MSFAASMGMSQRDQYLASRSGWLPATSLQALEDMRLEHERLIAQREARQKDVAALRGRFHREDQERQATLDDAYTNGTDPDLPDVTPAGERERLLADAKAHASAAAKAVMAHVDVVRERLRGGDRLPAGWNPYLEAQALRVPPGGEGEALMGQIAADESRLQEQIEEAERVIQVAGRRLREYQPLKVWLARNANGASGQLMPATDLSVPEAYTPMTKPVDLGVKGWAPSPDGIPDDAEEGVVDISDPWFAEREREQAEAAR